MLHPAVRSVGRTPGCAGCGYSNEVDPARRPDADPGLTGHPVADILGEHVDVAPAPLVQQAGDGPARCMLDNAPDNDP